MKPLTGRVNIASGENVRSWWANHGVTILRLAVATMAVFAVLKLGDEFRRLTWEQGPGGAVDLKLRYNEVRRWFAGLAVYGELEHAIYPPASYVMLWPFLGWLEITPARWLWGATTVGVLVWFTWLIVKESGAETPLQRVFVALLLLSINATGVVVGSGQLTVHLLVVLVAAVFFLWRGQQGWTGSLLAAGLLLVSLLKPNVSVPFFWIVLLASAGVGAILIAVAGYIALTLVAALYQGPSLTVLAHQYLERTSAVGVEKGYANLHGWLGVLGLKQWAIPASLLALSLLGLWVYRHRHSDLWLLLGVSGLAARFWAYHGVQDDVLVVLPEVALFRIARRGPSASGNDLVAGALLAITIVVMLAPARLYLWFPPPWKLVYTVSHTVVWLLTLIFLLNQTWFESKPRAC